MSDVRQTAFPFATLRASSAHVDNHAPLAVAEPAHGLRRTAVRVPESWQQAELVFPSARTRLFVHEGARQALEKKLEALLSETVHVSVTDNRRSMLSTVRRKGLLLVRAHHMFLDADAFTLRALARYIRRPSDRPSSDVLGAFIEAHRQKIASQPARMPALRTEGEQFDLGALFDDVNRRYFQGLVDAQITWGRPPNRSRKRKRQRTTIKLGSYCSDQKLIRIHPALDRDYVPRYFIEYVIFHEMLHHMVPMPIQAGRRIFHSAEFRARERAFDDYERALRWEKRHVGRLLTG